MSDEPLALRIDKLIKHSKGTMPVGMVVESVAEAEEAKRILAHRGRRGKLVTVYIQVGDDRRCIPA